MARTFRRGVARTLTASLRGLQCEPLESRDAPAVDLLRPHTATEVLARIDAVNPLGALYSAANRGRLLGIDLDASRPLGAGLVQVALTPTQSPAAAIAALAALENVAYAEPNYIVTNVLEDVTVNDPLFVTSPTDPTVRQANLARINVPAAWNILDKAGKTLGARGTVVAILDEGIDVISLPHQELTTTLWENTQEDSGSGLDNDGNGYAGDRYGYDFSDRDSNPAPSPGKTHGYSVAGVIGASTNNGVGIAGIAGGNNSVGGVRIMPLRVIKPVTTIVGGVTFTQDTTTAAWVAEAVNYAASFNVRLMNLSFNFSGLSDAQSVQDAFTNAYNAGVLMIASAGNEGVDAVGREAFNQVLFVASTNNSDGRSSFSNFGRFVDICAPGEHIVTLGVPAAGYTAAVPLDGTSFSAPAVTGVAALMLAQNPTLTRDQLAARLLGTAVNIDAMNPTQKGLLGTGRVDARAALQDPIAAPSITRMIIGDATVNEGAALTALNTLTLDVQQRFATGAVTAAAFELRADGSDNLFGTADDSVVPLALTTTYRIGASTIDLQVAGTLQPDHYRLTAKSGTPYLADPFGTPLNGTAGLNWTRSFDLAVPTTHFRYTAESTANTYFANAQTVPDVAINSKGAGVIVWESDGQDGSQQGIYARLIPANGQPVAAEFLVNVTTIGSQRAPSVAVNEDGSFIVVWHGAGIGSVGADIYLRRYSAAGQPLGTEVRVNSDTANDQFNPYISMNASGAYLIAWTSEIGQGTNSYDVKGRRFSSMHVALDASDATYNGVLAGQQSFGAVELQDDGRFLVAWSSIAPGLTENERDISVRAFNAAGVATTADTPLAMNVNGRQAVTDITRDGVGGYIVAFESAATEPTSLVYYRRVGTDGKVSSTAETLVNSGQTKSGHAAIAADAAGNFQGDVGGIQPIQRLRCPLSELRLEWRPHRRHSNGYRLEHPSRTKLAISDDAHWRYPGRMEYRQPAE